MNKEELRNVLTTNTHGQRLNLPLDALQSPPVMQQFGPLLGDQHFVLDGATTPKDEGGEIVVSGTGGNTLFQDIPLEARFIVADPIQLVLTTQDQGNWPLTHSFPKLEDTLLSDPLFDDARLKLSSQPVTSGTPINPALWFRGKLNLTSSLGLYSFLIGGNELVFSGQITARQDGIPEMELSTEEQDGISLAFFRLGPIKLRLVSRAAVSPRRNAAAYSRVYLEFHSSVQFTSRGQNRSIPLSAYI